MTRKIILFLGFLFLAGGTIGSAASSNSFQATILPSPVICEQSSVQRECLQMKIEGDTLTHYVGAQAIEGFDFRKGNTYLVELEENMNSDQGSDARYRLVKILSHSFDANTCTSDTYFDGCNRCFGSGNTTACTLMYCSEPEIAFCKYDEPLASTSVCTLEYKPVCSIVGVEYVNECMAKAAGITHAQAKYCLGMMTDTNRIVTRANINHLTQYTNRVDMMPNYYTTREQAAKILVEFSKLHDPYRPMSKMICQYNDIEHVSSELQTYIQDACNLRLLTGDSYGHFRPFDAFTFKDFKNTLSSLTSHDTINSIITPQHSQYRISRGDLYGRLYQLYLSTKNE